jgi:5,10-methylenetetrahydromethanopterin reductase
MASASQFTELGFYTLPGHVDDPKRILEEPVVGEQLGLGSVWVSERFGTKDAAVLSGVTLGRTERIGIATGLIGQLGLRNPLVTASYASTMMEVSDGRFALGIGRGIDAVADATGTPRVTFAYLEGYIDVLRRLWHGERVDHDSPVAHLRSATLGMVLDPAPPIIMAAMGDETCRWAGRHCDGVVFNSLWSPDAVAHSTRMVREGAEESGRDPASVRVWAILVTACEVPEETMLRTIVRRMNTYMYFPFFIEALCRVNGWDQARAAAVTARLKEIDAGGQAAGGTLGDEHTSRDLDALREMFATYPEEWIHQGNAVGDRDHCARAVLARFEAGADGVLFHGSSPQDLAPVLAAWPRYRPDGLAQRPANPGL